MKARIVKAHNEFRVGEAIDPTPQDFEVLNRDGIAVSETEWNTLQANEQFRQNAIKAREARVEKAIAKACEQGRLPAADKEAVDKVKARAMAMESVEDGVGEEFVLNLPVKAGQGLEGRQTQAARDDGGRYTELRMGDETLAETSQFVLKCSEPQNQLIRSGNFKEAHKLGIQAGSALKYRMIKAAAKDDFMLRDVVKAATFTDPNSQVGSMAGDLIIMRNLGYLVYKLPWLKKLTTDMTGEPVRFGQSILTRYITPPAVLTWVPGVGFTNAADSGFGAQQVSDSGTGTTQSAGVTLRSGGGGNYELDATNNFGIPVKSTPSTTDKSVTLNMFKATEIEFPVSMLAGTVRNLLGEQLGAQTYSLAEEINKYVLAVLFAATWGTGGVSGLTYTYTKALANWSLAGLIGLKNKLTIAKIPDVGRFALLHSFYHDKLLEDSNLLNAKAILALINKDMASFESGELPEIFGIKPLESQLASATSAGALTTWVDDTTLGTTAIVGFAGNMSSGLFVSRPPQDYTTALTSLGIPQTASIRLMTEPDSGLTVMVFSYADNGKMSINQRVCLMWGAAQGDPRQGILIKPE